MKKHFFRDMKIGKKLTLSYLLACLVPLLTISVVIYEVSALKLEEASLELASVFSSQIVANLDDFIEEYDKVTKSVLVDNDVIYELGDKENDSVTEQVNRQLEVRKIMFRLMTLKPEIENIMLLTDRDKLYQFSDDGANADVQVLLKQNWLEKLMESEEQVSITAIHDKSYYDRDSDGIVLTVGRRIFDYGGAQIGFLLIDLKPSSLISLSDGFLLTRSNYNIKINITDTEDGLLYDSDVASGRMTWDEALSLDASEMKRSDEFLVLTNETKRGNLKINVIIPRSSLLFKISKIRYVTFLALLICVFVVAVVSSLFGQRITKPIRKLQKNMELVEKGKYQQLIQKESNDEIGNLVTSYNQMVQKIKILIENIYIAEIKQKNARLLALQTQINPHMLYNTLDSIRMKALINGDDEVADMIKILAKMFRNALGKQEGSSRIRDEIDYVENYIKLQNLRYQGLFSFQADLEEKILDAFIIPMVLQPIVENSIEYGFKGHGIPLHIVLKGKVMDEKNIFLQICDDGRGISPEKIQEIDHRINQLRTQGISTEIGKEEKETSIGLKNIAERIYLQYGNGFYLRINNQVRNGTAIEILIPGQWE